MADWPDRKKCDMPNDLSANVWRCTIHHVNTTSDCPKCDAELISLTEREVAR